MLGLAPFPEGQEILICGAGHGGLTGHSKRSARLGWPRAPMGSFRRVLPAKQWYDRRKPSPNVAWLPPPRLPNPVRSLANPDQIRPPRARARTFHSKRLHERGGAGFEFARRLTTAARSCNFCSYLENALGHIWFDYIPSPLCSINLATRAVQPVWWLAPSPAPLSPLKNS